MDAININQINSNEKKILEFEEKITCGKIKSKAKTILVSNIDKIIDYNSVNKAGNNITNLQTLKLGTITFDFVEPTNFDLICNYLTNSKIIISNQSDPKNSLFHIIEIPGYICNIKKISPTQLELDANFKKFFPINIPIYNKFYPGLEKIHIMIWFKNMIPNELIKKTTIVYKLENIEINESNSFKNNLIPVQQTQTFYTICKNKTLDIVKKTTNFNNMSRAFWIKMNKIDYENLNEIKLELNGQTRITLDRKKCELICDKKNIVDNNVLIFLNLELDDDNNDWSLPSNLCQISKIYSNSLNCSRIDKIVWHFKFENKFTNGDIFITSLCLKELSIDYNKLLERFC